MSIFDLAFLCVVLGSFIALLSSLIAAARGQRHKAWILLRAWGIFIAIYLCTAAVSRLTLPIRELTIGDPQCSDDWCITVTAVHPVPQPARMEYDVDLRLNSRARRVAQREKGLVVYLRDAQGKRYNPIPDPAALPLDTLLQAGESMVITRKFDLPGNPGSLQFIVTREGFGMGWLIIGRSPFTRTVVRIP